MPKFRDSLPLHEKHVKRTKPPKKKRKKEYDSGRSESNDDDMNGSESYMASSDVDKRKKSKKRGRKKRRHSNRSSKRSRSSKRHLKKKSKQKHRHDHDRNDIESEQYESADRDDEYDDDEEDYRRRRSDDDSEDSDSEDDDRDGSYDPEDDPAIFQLFAALSLFCFAFAVGICFKYGGLKDCGKKFGPKRRRAFRVMIGTAILSLVIWIIVIVVSTSGPKGDSSSGGGANAYGDGEYGYQKSRGAAGEEERNAAKSGPEIDYHSKGGTKSGSGKPRHDRQTAPVPPIYHDEHIEGATCASQCPSGLNFKIGHQSPPYRCQYVPNEFAGQGDVWYYCDTQEPVEPFAQKTIPTAPPTMKETLPPTIRIETLTALPSKKANVGSTTPNLYAVCQRKCSNKFSRQSAGTGQYYMTVTEGKLTACTWMNGNVMMDCL